MRSTARRRVAVGLAAALLLAGSPGLARAEDRTIAADGRGARLRTAGWVGLSATVALVAAGGVFGLTARARSDDLSALLAGRGEGGQPLPFDARTEARATTLRAEGREADSYAIGFFAAAAVAGLATAALFTVAALRRPAPLAVQPELSRQGAGVRLVLRF